MSRHWVVLFSVAALSAGVRAENPRTAASAAGAIATAAPSPAQEQLPPDKEFEKRRAAIDGKDVAELMKLYTWAKGANLKTQAKSVLRDILDVEPDNATARELLGYKKFGDKWVTEKEYERLAAEAEKKEKMAKGLVEYKGQWVTPAEKEEKEHTDKGEVLLDGEWVNKKDIEAKKREAEARKEADDHRLKGEYLVDGKWVPKADAEKHFASAETPYRAESDHIVLTTNRGIDFGEKMLVVAEGAYRKSKDFFGAEPPKGKKIHVFVAAALKDYNAAGNQVNADEKSSNFYSFTSPWLPESKDAPDLLSCTMYHENDWITERYTRDAVAEQFVYRLIGKDAADIPPRWFIDGVACYVDRWSTDEDFKWSRKYLRGKGALAKLKSFLGNYQANEQSILQTGLLIAFVKSPKCPPEVQTAFTDAIGMIGGKGKVGKAFRKLEKELINAETAFLDYAQ